MSSHQDDRDVTGLGGGRWGGWGVHGADFTSLTIIIPPAKRTCQVIYWFHSIRLLGWVGLWGFLWWAPSAKRKDHHGVSSGWSSVWHCSNTGLSSTQYEQIPIILGVWPFWLTPFFFRSITFWGAYGWIVFPLLKWLSFFWLTYYCSIGLCFSVRV